MTKFIIRWAINVVGLYAAVWLVDGIEYLGDWTGIFGQRQRLDRQGHQRRRQIFAAYIECLAREPPEIYSGGAGG